MVLTNIENIERVRIKNKQKVEKKSKK